MRARHVDHHGGVHIGAVGKGDTGDTPVDPTDVGHLGVEPELAALGLGCTLQVVAGQLRVAHVAGVRRVERTHDLALGLFPEAVVGGPGRLAVGAVLEEREAFGQLLVAEDLVGHPDLVEQWEDLFVVATFEHEQHGAGLHVEGVAALVLAVEVVGPVLPVGEALVGHGHAVKGGVVGSHDCAGVAGRPVAGGRQFVDVQGPPTLLGQFEGDGGADHPRTDDDCVVTLVVVHCFCSGNQLRRRRSVRGR